MLDPLDERGAERFFTYLDEITPASVKVVIPASVLQVLRENLASGDPLLKVVAKRSTLTIKIKMSWTMIRRILSGYAGHATELKIEELRKG